MTHVAYGLATITTKRCSRCRVEKKASLFSASYRTKDWLDNICRDCLNSAARARYKKRVAARREAKA